MPSVWITALKKYNSGKGAYCIPKKGTKQYDEVKKIMDSMKRKKK